MDYDSFIHFVEQQAGATRGEAEQAVQATLATLAERISAGEADDIARQLPPQLHPFLRDGIDAEPFDLEEFLRRISEREGVARATAEQHARAVFATLGRAVGEKEIADVAAELPRDFLITRLPVAFDPPLRRGKGQSNGAARPLSLEEFLGHRPARGRHPRRGEAASVRCSPRCARRLARGSSTTSSRNCRRTMRRCWHRPAPEPPEAQVGQAGSSPSYLLANRLQIVGCVDVPACSEISALDARAGE